MSPSRWPSSLWHSSAAACCSKPPFAGGGGHPSNPLRGASNVLEGGQPMTLKAFTDNFADNSTEAGFAFTFFCDHCNEGFKSQFIASTTYKKGRMFSGLGKMAGAAT